MSREAAARPPNGAISSADRLSGKALRVLVLAAAYATGVGCSSGPPTTVCTKPARCETERRPRIASAVSAKDPESPAADASAVEPELRDAGLEASFASIEPDGPGPVRPSNDARVAAARDAALADAARGVDAWAPDAAPDATPDASLDVSPTDDTSSIADAGSINDSSPDATCALSAGCAPDPSATFVSPYGNDARGTGTQSSPYATINKAMWAARSNTKQVVLCSDEHAAFETPTLQISSALDGTRLRGGYRCNDWRYDGRRTVVRSSGTTAIKLERVEDLSLEDLHFEASDAAQPGGSSIAGIVARSDRVVMTRVTFTAGDGADGAPGENGKDGADAAPVQAAQSGKDGICAIFDDPFPRLNGGTASSNSCGSAGGAGGGSRARTDGLPGRSGTPPYPSLPLSNGGFRWPLPTPGSDGSDGSSGSAGTPGSLPLSLGQFTASTYTPPSRADGTNGQAGQGGGGGGGGLSVSAGAATCLGATGGAGGSGGCPGARGTGGTGGGASVALLVWDSELLLADCTLRAATGGDGGPGGGGGRGGAGVTGAPGGAPAQLFVETLGYTGAGLGGRGGRGGAGGPGSGGAGGPSIALVFHSDRPTLEASSLVSGESGRGGEGGPLGDDPTQSAPTGPDGQESLVYEQP